MRTNCLFIAELCVRKNALLLFSSLWEQNSKLLFAFPCSLTILFLLAALYARASIFLLNYFMQDLTSCSLQACVWEQTSCISHSFLKLQIFMKLQPSICDKPPLWAALSAARPLSLLKQHMRMRMKMLLTQSAAKTHAVVWVIHWEFTSMQRFMEVNGEVEDRLGVYNKIYIHLSKPKQV